MTAPPAQRQALKAWDYLRPEVRAFATIMERKLRDNDHKEHWRSEKMNLARLETYLEQEVNELKGALEDAFTDEWIDAPEGDFFAATGLRRKNGKLEIVSKRVPRKEDFALQYVALEAADVANFAMMIADKIGALAYDATEAAGRDMVRQRDNRSTTANID